MQNLTQFNYLEMTKMDEKNARLYRDITIKSLDEISDQSDMQIEKIRQSYTQRVSDRLKKRQENWDQIFENILNNSLELDKDLPGYKPRVTFAAQTIIFEIPARVPKNKPNKSKSSLDESLPEKSSLHYSNTQTTPVENIAEEPKIDTIENNPTPPPKSKDLFSNESAIENYLRLQNVLIKAKQSYSSLTDNAGLENYKNDLKLYMKSQINGISNQQQDHLREKITRLSSLFSGKSVKYIDRYIDTRQHEAAPIFCLDLAAQFFATVGPKQVPSVSQAASNMAFVANSLIDSHPLFGELLIGHIQQRCPYTVPIYPSRDNVSEINYKIACGYNFSPLNQTEKLETYDKYISRMRSLIQIYSSMCQKRRVQDAWSWLAAMLNLKPEPEITATIIQAFLKESSVKLRHIYGTQYAKILRFLEIKYLPMIMDTSKTHLNRDNCADLQTFIKRQSSGTPLASFNGSVHGDTGIGGASSIFGTSR